MNFDKMNNRHLLENTEILVKSEKEFTLKILKNLCEIDKRKLFVALEFNSLYTYCRDHLKYSDQESTIRVNAARLIKTSKFAEEKLEKKEITLTVAADLYSHMKKFNESSDKKLTVNQKNSLINEVSNQSSRAAKKIIQQELNLSVEIKCEIKLKKETVERMNRLKEKLDIHDYDLFLNALMQEKEDSLKKEREYEVVTSAPVSNTTPINVENRSRYIPLKIKRGLFKLAQYRCEFINRDGLRCNARTHLQIEHKVPHSLGGSNCKTNLKIYCSTHNQFTGIHVFGHKKMNRYITLE